ncbi:hypothetical protein P5E66_15055 [Clostridium perfringens]|nr:hypothetical protein [Clostridium perfringens]
MAEIKKTEQENNREIVSKTIEKEIGTTPKVKIVQSNRYTSPVAPKYSPIGKVKNLKK